MVNTRKSTLIWDFDLIAVTLRVSMLLVTLLFMGYRHCNSKWNICVILKSNCYCPMLSESSFHSCGTSVTSLTNFKDFKEHLLWSFSGEQINLRIRLFLWCREDEKRAESGGGRPRYWVTQRSAHMFTFPLIALHLRNHVKLACMLAPHSVHSQSHTQPMSINAWDAHPPTHTHTTLLLSHLFSCVAPT